MTTQNLLVHRIIKRINHLELNILIGNSHFII